MYLHGVEKSKHGPWELLGSWQKKEAEEQNKKKKHQGQDSSIAVLTMRRGYRIKLISDGAGGSQGIQPGRLTEEKKKRTTGRCSNTNLLLWLHSCNLNKLKGCYWVPALLMSVGQAEREHIL